MTSTSGDGRTILIVHERAVWGWHSIQYAQNHYAPNWDCAPKAWFVITRGDRWSITGRALGFAFATRDDIPLPATVRDRMAAMDLTTEERACIPGLGALTRHSEPDFASDAEYELEITQTEYDQLLAALGENDE